MNGPTNLDQLLEAIRAGRYEEDGDLWDGENTMTSLPTFGGPEPRDTNNVWSWDERRLLVQDLTGDKGFYMVKREDWSA